MNTYRIVRRAWSTYTTVGTLDGTYLQALNVAGDMERQERDGEYLVRELGEQDWSANDPSGQSGMDWL